MSYTFILACDPCMAGRDTMALGLHKKQVDEVRLRFKRAHLGDEDRRFYLTLMKEVPFHIFMNYRDSGDQPEGDCLFLFANKYNLPKKGSVAGFITSEPKLLSAFKDIFEAARDFHNAFPELAKRNAERSMSQRVNSPVPYHPEFQ